MKRLLALLLLIPSLLQAGIPNVGWSTGSLTAAGVAVTVVQPGVNGYNILLDGSALATSTVTVAVQVLDPVTNTYVTPAAIGNPSTTLPVTLGTAQQVVQCPGAYPGIQVNVTSFGTATGTFRAVIMPY